MPTSTYDLISNTVLGSSSTSITFSSIPTTYRDLVLVVDYVGVSDGSGCFITFNSDSGGNYNRVEMSGDGTNTASLADTNNTAFVLTNNISWNTSTGGRLSIIVNIMDYQQTNQHKNILVRSNNSGRGVIGTAGRWASTAAITSVTISGNFASSSSFGLYGIVS